MALTSPSAKADTAQIVERAVTRINGDTSAILDGAGEENTTALVLYLVENGIHDEDELVELTLLAEGKRYNPVDGTFT